MADSTIQVLIDATLGDFDAVMAAAGVSVQEFSEQATEAAQAVLNSTYEMGEAAKAAGGAVGSAMAEVGRSMEAAALQGEASFAGLRESLSLTGENIRLFTSSASELGEALLVVFAADKIKEFATSTAELGAQLVHMSEASGMSVEDLEKLRFAATTMDVPFERMTRVFAQFELKLEELRSGSKNQALSGALGDLNLDPAKLQTEGLSQAFADVAHAMTEAKARGEDMSRVLGDISEIIGTRIGVEMVPMLENWDELNAKAAQTQTLTGQQAEDLDRMNELINQIGFHWDEFKASVAATVFSSDEERLTELAGYVQQQGFATKLQQEEIDQLTAKLHLAAGATSGLNDELARVAAEHLDPFKGNYIPTTAAEAHEAIMQYDESQRQAAEATRQENDAEKQLARTMTSEGQAAFDRMVAYHKELEAAAKAATAAELRQEETIDKWVASLTKTATPTERLADDLDRLNVYLVSGDISWEQYQAAIEGLGEKFAKLDIDGQAQKLKALSDEVGSIVTPITSAFEQSFTGVIQGTQTLQQAWKRMLDSMGLELLKSGLHDILLGGSKNTIGGAVFGISGEGGGIAGQIAAAFQGSAVSAGLRTALSNAWTGITGPISTAFGQAFTAIGGILRSVFGSALSGLGGAAASGAGSALASAAGAAGSATEVGLLTTIAGTDSLILSTDVAANVALDLMNVTLQGILATDLALLAKPSALGFTFAGGGVVPSGSLGIPALLHPNEMVLDPRLSEFVQRAAASSSGDGGFGGGGSPIIITQNNTIGAGADAGSLRSVLRDHANDIADAVASSLRHGHATGQGFHRGAFRR